MGSFCRASVKASIKEKTCSNLCLSAELRLWSASNSETMDKQKTVFNLLCSIICQFVTTTFVCLNWITEGRCFKVCFDFFLQSARMIIASFPNWQEQIKMLKMRELRYTIGTKGLLYQIYSSTTIGTKNTIGRSS